MEVCFTIDTSDRTEVEVYSTIARQRGLKWRLTLQYTRQRGLKWRFTLQWHVREY